MDKLQTRRREFLKFLAASPLLSVSARLLAEETLAQTDLPDYLIDKPEDALDVFDFHAVAKQKLPPAHYGYLTTGTDGNETLSANRRAFEDYYLRPMRMVDTSQVNLATSLLGQELESPIVLAPVGSQAAFHPDAELASARAAKAQNHLQILSNVASNPIEDVIAARGEPVWFQFYPTSQWPTAKMMLERAEAAGAKVVVLTVDLNSGSNRVLLERYIRTDDRDCSACHGDGSVELPRTNAPGHFDEDRRQGHRDPRRRRECVKRRRRRGLRLQPRWPGRSQRPGRTREPAGSR